MYWFNNDARDNGFLFIFHRILKETLPYTNTLMAVNPPSCPSLYQAKLCFLQPGTTKKPICKCS